MRTTLLALALLCGTACQSIGPRTIPRDRFDYSRAIAESWKHQLLLNLVKLRYQDVPIWLDVGQVVSGYSLETTGNLGGQFSSQDALQGNSLTLGAGGRFTDRPTITYNPLTGDRFLESFLTPIQPVRLFSLIQAGYGADFVLELATDSIQGLHNRSSRTGSTRPADPSFFRALDLLRAIQEAGAVGIRIEESTDERPATVVFLGSDSNSPEIQAQIDELGELLGARGPRGSYELVFSPLRLGEGRLAVGSRSILQLLIALTSGIDVPAGHVERGLNPPSADTSLDTLRPPLLRVRSGPEHPEESFVAIEYERAWFWIETADWRSRGTFATLLFLFSLAGTGGGENPPTITIPAQ